jgi:hypothetical protein
MSVIRFPMRRAACIWVRREEASWLVQAGNHAWQHGDYRDADRDASWLSQNYGLPVRLATPMSTSHAHKF